MSMIAQQVFRSWSREQTQKFQKEIFSLQHKLSETGLFSDEALIELLEKHPSHKLDVMTMGDHALYPNRFRAGDFRGCNGKDLLEAAKAGSVWMNVREAMNIHPEYKAELNKMYGALAEITGKPSYKARGGILISSPIAKVPYHCDQTQTILWHVRGKKRMFLYPVNEQFLPNEAYERLVTRSREDDVPYRREFDKSAAIFDLAEGEMISWPLNAPHKVENETFCVSVTTEYSTFESAFKNAVTYTNAVMRQRFGTNPNWYTAGLGEKYAKFALGKILRKLKAYRGKGDDPDFITFRVDRSAPGYIVDIEPVLRNF